MKIPLQLKLKKKVHQSIAYAQDLIVEELYRFFPKAILHGGTAIWRCYQGNRFSEDIDAYLPRKEPLNAFFESLSKKGFRIVKKRIKEHSLYSLLEFMRVPVRFEALFVQKQNAALKEYETAQGTFTHVYTLSPSDLIEEKKAAFLKRKKIRDLYDIFFLVQYLKNKKNLDLKKLKEIQIEDEKNLKALIITGPFPTAK